MKIGIIGAMVEEVELLRGRIEATDTRTLVGMEYVEGRLGGKDVVLVVCGVGKVNAAICAQLLITEFGVTHIVFTGVAGSLDASVDICDIVVSTDCLQHDFDVSGLGYRPGVIPDQDVSCFVADETLRAVAVQAIREVAPEVGVHEGRVASGDQFVADPVANRRVNEEFGALCCEMEGAAVAQVAWRNDVPYVVVRAISDRADGAADEEYPNFKVEAANRSASIIERLMQLIPA